MASKRADQPITKLDLEKFIETQDDFAMELYAYSLARDLGFTATHAGSYIDRITGKTRQFDVRANRSCGLGLNLYVAIECKCLRPSFPLLISQIPRLPSESFQDIMQSAGNVANEEGRTRLIDPRVLRVEGLRSIYSPNLYVGKGVVQVGYNEAGGFIAKDSEIYDKWGQAIASLNDLIREASNLHVSTGGLSDQ
jgi:hypothetical protein